MITKLERGREETRTMELLMARSRRVNVLKQNKLKTESSGRPAGDVNKMGY